MKSITILLLIFTVTCNSQTEFKSISNDIVDFYIVKNEVDKESKQKILDNFKGLVTIKNLVSNDNFKCCKAGVYKVSLNISHTSTNLLILNKNNYNILSIDDDFTNVFNKLSTVLRNNTLINKEQTIKCLESLVKIAEENRNMKKNNTLEDIR